MKKNPNQGIITAIKLRQLELATKAAKIALKEVENPSKTFNGAVKVACKILSITLEVAKLQKMKRQLEPKPEMAMGGTLIRNEDEILIKKP